MRKKVAIILIFLFILCACNIPETAGYDTFEEWYSYYVDKWGPPLELVIEAENFRYGVWEVDGEYWRVNFIEDSTSTKWEHWRVVEYKLENYTPPG